MDGHDRRAAASSNAERARPLAETDPEVDDRPPEILDLAHRDLVLKGLEQSRRGEVASEEEVRAVLASFRP